MYSLKPQLPETEFTADIYPWQKCNMTKQQTVNQDRVTIEGFNNFP